MSSDERSGDYSPPKGYESLGKELDTLLWISKSLSLTERIKSCKRLDALRVSLTEMLEDPTMPSPGQLRDNLSSQSSVIERLERQVKELKEKIASIEGQQPSKATVLKWYPELETQSPDLGFWFFHGRKVMWIVILSFLSGFVMNLLIRAT